MLRLKFARSTSFRSGGLYSALFLTAVFSIFIVTYLSVSDHVRASLNASIEQDIQSLTTEYNVQGALALKEGVDERIAETQGFDRLYAFFDEKGVLVSGNIIKLPDLRGRFAGSLQTRADPRRSAEPTVDIIGEIQNLGGGQLFVGRNTQQMKNTLLIIRQSFLIGGVCTLAAALLLGILFGRIAARRVEGISVLTRSIVQEGLKGRIPLRGTGDEFDNLSADINVMLDRIQELMDGIRHSSDNIAHELRTPLTRIRNGLEVVLNERPAKISHLRSAIMNSIAEADSVIETFRALLRISQIEDGTRRSQFKRADLSELLKNVFDIYEPVAENAGLTLQANLVIGIFIDADQELLTQLFANLIENCIRYVPSGGKIKLALEKKADRITVSVADNGPGIPAAEREKVFRRLYKIEQSRGSLGSGLGLSLVAAIASLHGAEITLHDNGPGLDVKIRFVAIKDLRNFEP